MLDVASLSFSSESRYDQYEERTTGSLLWVFLKESKKSFGRVEQKVMK